MYVTQHSRAEQHLKHAHWLVDANGLAVFKPPPQKWGLLSGLCSSQVLLSVHMGAEARGSFSYNGATRVRFCFSEQPFR